jgi:hypothetical protein
MRHLAVRAEAGAPQCSAVLKLAKTGRCRAPSHSIPGAKLQRTQLFSCFYKQGEPTAAQRVIAATSGHPAMKILLLVLLLGAVLTMAALGEPQRRRVSRSIHTLP